ncbi:retrovirus-related pol polyprotein from transposon TNT 1-94 [Tanacetum coccineum]
MNLLTLSQNASKKIQVRLNTTVYNVRTDNGTEFVNQTLREFYENVGISHQTSVARTPQQNSIVERQNHTLMKAARTMLIFSKASLFLMHDKKSDLSFLHVFSSLYYPTNDSEDLGMASEQFSSEPGLQFMTPGTLSLGLVSNPPSLTPYVPPTNNDWVILFQPMFDELLHPPPSVVSPVLAIAAQRPVDPTSSPVSTSIDQDAPSSSNPSTQEQEQSSIISQDVEESLKIPHFHDDPLHEDKTSQGSSSNVRPSHTLLDLLGKWTKNHPLAIVIGDPS